MKSLPQKELDKIRQQVTDSVRPLIFFHDDPDGLASYLQIVRVTMDGKGIPIKTTPIIDSKFMRFVHEFQPDRLFIVDIAIVEQDFLDEVNVPVTWIDHHQVLDRDKVSYFNPRKHQDKNVPASEVIYDALLEDDWIAMIGIVGDWVYPEMAKEFSKEHYELLPPEIDTPEDALFNSKLGFLTNMFSFLLKGNMKDVRKSIDDLTKIKSAEELLEGTSERAKRLKERFEPIYREYQELLALAMESRTDSSVMQHVYGDNKWSFTKEISNEIYYKNSDKLVAIGREREGKVKLSLRYKGNILSFLDECLSGLEGRGGGHEHACGVVVTKEDYPEFIKRLESHAQAL